MLQVSVNFIFENVYLIDVLYTASRPVLGCFTAASVIQFLDLRFSSLLWVTTTYSQKYFQFLDDFQKREIVKKLLRYCVSFKYFKVIKILLHCTIFELATVISNNRWTTMHNLHLSSRTSDEINFQYLVIYSYFSKLILFILLSCSYYSHIFK